jgi:hypothetical protein
VTNNLNILMNLILYLKQIQGMNQGDRGVLLMKKKNGSQKSFASVPLSTVSRHHCEVPMPKRVCGQ